MPRRVKDFIEIGDYTSLDKLISYLKTIRDNLPNDAEAEIKVRGDDVFGRRLAISWLRELTPEEAALQGRYSDADLAEPDADIEALRGQLDRVPFDKAAGSGS